MKCKRMLYLFFIIMQTGLFVACGEVQGNEFEQGKTNLENQTGNIIERQEETVGEDNVDEDKKGIEQEFISEESDEELENDEYEQGIPLFKTIATIEETVLVDEHDVKVIATSLTYSDWDVEINLIFENNSSKDISIISASNGYCCNAVNGYMIDDGYVNVDVPAGKKVVEDACFCIEELVLYGITEIADIQMGFYVTDDNYNYIYIEPKQIKTSIFDSYNYAINTYAEIMNSGAIEMLYECTIDYYAEEELYNSDGVRIVSEGIMTNKEGEKIVFFEIYNNSDKLLYGVTSDILINGVAVYSYEWSDDFINPGARRIMLLDLNSKFDEVFFDAYEMSDIFEVEFQFALEDAYYNEMVKPQIVTIRTNETENEIVTSGSEVYNENGIRIVVKGIEEDVSAYSNNVHMFLMIENNYHEMIEIEDVYGSFAVNGFMTDCTAYGVEVEEGRYGAIDVEIWGSSLEKNGIDGIEAIREAEIKFKIRDKNYKVIAEPIVKFDF